MFNLIQRPKTNNPLPHCLDLWDLVTYAVDSSVGIQKRLCNEEICKRQKLDITFDVYSVVSVSKSTALLTYPFVIVQVSHVTADPVPSKLF